MFGKLKRFVASGGLRTQVQFAMKFNLQKWFKAAQTRKFQRISGVSSQTQSKAQL